VFTGKQGRSDKQGKLKADRETQSATAILSKLGIADGMWCDLGWKDHWNAITKMIVLSGMILDSRDCGLS
jgi:hypothetical protein